MRRLRALALVLCVGVLLGGGLTLAPPAHAAVAGSAVAGSAGQHSPSLPLMACQQSTHCPAGGLTTGAVLAGLGLLAALTLLAGSELTKLPWRRRRKATMRRPGVRATLLRPPQPLPAV